MLLIIFSSRKKIELSNADRIFVAFLSIFPDIDYIIDLVYGTEYHTLQFIPLILSLTILSMLYLFTEKYHKLVFLCLIGIGSQFFGDMLVGVYTYRILAHRLHVIPGNFFLFMVSFEFIMPIIFFVFLLMKKFTQQEEIEIYES